MKNKTGFLGKLKKSYNEYKAAEPQRREKRLSDLKYKTNVAQQEAKLLKAQRQKEKYKKPAASFGFGTMGSTPTPRAAPMKRKAAAPTKKRKKRQMRAAEPLPSPKSYWEESVF